MIHQMSDLAPEEDNGATQEIKQLSQLAEQNQVRNLDKAANYAQRALLLAKTVNFTYFNALNCYVLGSNYLQKAKHQLALTHLHKALGYLNVDNKEQLIVPILIKLGETYLKINTIDLSIDQFQAALAQARTPYQKAQIHLNLGIAFQKKGDFAQSIQQFFEAQNWVKEVLDNAKSKQLGAKIAASIGNIYLISSDFNQALEYYLNSIELSEQQQNQFWVTPYLGIGDCYGKMGKPKMALWYYQKAKKIAKAQQDQNHLAKVLGKIGACYLDLDEIEKGTDYLQRAINLNSQREYVQQQHLGEWRITLSRFYLKQDKLGKAKNYALQALQDLLKSDDRKRLPICYETLVAIFEANNNYKQALHYHKLLLHTQNQLQAQNKADIRLQIEAQTALKAREREIDLLQEQNRLQTALLGKSDEIADKNDQLKSANEELQRFTYIASHDLKAPLRMVGKFTQLMQKELGLQTNDRLQAYMDEVVGGVDRMGNLLDDLLQYARVGKNNTPPQTVDLNDIMMIVQSNLRVIVEENNANIQLSTTPLPKVKAHASQMLQLFQNLIGNAIKFRGEQQPILTIESELEENTGKWCVRISDNGIGIDMEDQYRIFKPFERLDTPQHREGTGIGLAICHKIIHQMGGRIWVESELNQGTTFYFTLPTA